MTTLEHYGFITNVPPTPRKGYDVIYNFHTAQWESMRRPTNVRASSSALQRTYAMKGRRRLSFDSVVHETPSIVPHRVRVILDDDITIQHITATVVDDQTPAPVVNPAPQVPAPDPVPSSVPSSASNPVPKVQIKLTGMLAKRKATVTVAPLGKKPATTGAVHPMHTSALRMMR